MSRRCQRDIDLLGHTSFLDTMANAVGAMAFVLLLVVVVTVTLKLNWYDLAIQTKQLPPAYVGEPYDVVLAGVGGNEPYHWSLIAGDLPTGLEFEPDQDSLEKSSDSRPRIHGVPQKTIDSIELVFRLEDTPIAQNITVESPDAIQQLIRKPAVEQRFLLEVRHALFTAKPLQIKTRVFPTAMLESVYAVDLSAIGGTPPYYWGVTDAAAIPPGLQVVAEKGQLAGSPLQAGLFRFGLSVQDAIGNRSRSADLALEIIDPAINSEPRSMQMLPLELLTNAVPPAISQQDYQVIFSAHGGQPPYSWFFEGVLPDGLLFDSESGAITGQPLTSGNTTFDLIVRDTLGTEDQVTLDLKIYPSAMEQRLEEWWKYLILALIATGYFLLRMVIARVHQRSVQAFLDAGGEIHQDVNGSYINGSILVQQNFRRAFDKRRRRLRLLAWSTGLTAILTFLLILLI